MKTKTLLAVGILLVFGGSATADPVTSSKTSDLSVLMQEAKLIENNCYKGGCPENLLHRAADIASLMAEKAGVVPIADINTFAIINHLRTFKTCGDSFCGSYEAKTVAKLLKDCTTEDKTVVSNFPTECQKYTVQPAQ